MNSSNPTCGTPTDLDGLPQPDTPSSIQHLPRTADKPVPASAEETLPSPPQQEPEDPEPRSALAERTIHAKPGPGAPLHCSPVQPSNENAVAAIAGSGAEDSLLSAGSDRMLVDDGREEQHSSSEQASSNIANEKASAQLPHDSLPQEHRLPAQAPPSLLVAVKEEDAPRICTSVPENESSSEVTRPETFQTQPTARQRRAENSSSSGISSLTDVSELSMRFSVGSSQATTPAGASDTLIRSEEQPPSNGLVTPNLAPTDDCPSIPQAYSAPGSPLKTTPPRRTIHKVKPKSSIPHDIPLTDYAAQCIAAAESSRLNPYGLEIEEHALLRQHITHAQVTSYLNIRNGIVRLWLRKPHIAITRNEAIGCAKESRWFDLASLCFDWLVRRGYINYGCVEIKEPHKVGRPRRSHVVHSPPAFHKRRKRIVIIGAGMAGLGCARQLHNLFKQYRSQFDELDEQAPEVVVLEGRERVGGRVYSRAFEVQPQRPHPNFPQSRCTAEMGGMIVTGFDRGNPMNTLVRGQLGLGYHALLSTTTIYDVDGEPVDIVRDGMVENLFNECLDRVSEYKYKMPVPKTVYGNRDNIDGGRDSSSDGHRTIAHSEEAAAARAAAAAASRSTPGTPSSQGPRTSQGGIGTDAAAAMASPRVDLVPVSSDRLTGRARLEPGTHAALKAAHKVKAMGWDLKPGVDESRDLDLEPATSTPRATFGNVVEEAIKQYGDLIDLNAQDYRLLNWHVANLEYSNAINHNKLSLLAWDLDAGNEWDGPHSMVIGGYQSVARGLMLCPSPLDVRYKMAVAKITYAGLDDAPGSIDAADGGETYKPPVTIECEDGQMIEADYVVNSMPLGVLKHGNVEFSPPLPSWKSGAIGRIGFGVLNKIILTYRQPFWDTERDIFGILRQPSNRFSLKQNEYSSCRGRMFQWFNATKTAGIPCLIALMAGDAAFAQEKTGNDKLVAEATSVLRSVFGADRVPPPIEAVVTRWVSDKFARGSYSSAGPDMKVDDYDVMARAVGKHLYFAGEHTIGTYPATVHGAYLSGVRAASDLIDELLGPIQFPTPLVLPKEAATLLKRKLAIDHDERGMPGDESSSGSVSASGSANSTRGSGGYREAKATSRRRMEAREARILEHIAGHIGNRPVRPPKTGDTAYLLFSRAHYDLARKKCDEGRRPGKGRAQPNEVRVLTSKMWRSASAEERQPFADQAALLKKQHDEAVQDFLKKAAEWDEQAKKLRSEYERDHPEDGSVGVSATPDRLGSPFIGGLHIDGGRDATSSTASLHEQQPSAASTGRTEDDADVDMTG